MAKSARAQLDAGLVTVEKGAAAARNREPAAQPERVAMTFRIRHVDHDYLRQLAFETRRPQQSFVDDALELLRNNGSMLARASMKAGT
jgi:hypothetical protein